jgi:sugar phosphate isomerase/epimerase
VVLALENHWGFTASAAGTCRIIETLDSPWMGAMIDTGNFLEGDLYAEIEAMAPHAVLVQAKAYPGGGLYYTLDLDYPRIIDIFRRHGYRGALSLEMEGNAHPDEGVPAALAMLRAALAR